jgi:iron complex outermembrane receptor protein
MVLLKRQTGKKYGNFPSLGLAQTSWQERGLVNDLKLRVNAGKTGNTEFPRNSSVVSLNTMDQINSMLLTMPILNWHGKLQLLME